MLFLSSENKQHGDKMVKEFSKKLGAKHLDNLDRNLVYLLRDIPVVWYERWEKGDIDLNGKGENQTQNRLQLLNKSLTRDGFSRLTIKRQIPV